MSEYFAISTPQLQIRWFTDRGQFRHEILVKHNDAWVRLASSRFVDESPPGETSPAWQQIHCQRIEGAPVLMGVGIHNGCHWSCAAKSTMPELGGDPQNIELDYAVRVNREINQLVMLYDCQPSFVLGSNSVLGLGENSVQLTTDQLGFRLVIESSRETTWDFSDQECSLGIRTKIDGHFRQVSTLSWQLNFSLEATGILSDAHPNPAGT